MARSDRRDNLQVSDTPFARVLTAYLWSKQPPWSATRLATVLGINRARVVNWIYHGTDPDLETMLVVLANLQIPVSELINAYAERGIPVPPLTREDSPRQEGAEAATGGNKPLEQQALHPIPTARQGRWGQSWASKGEKGEKASKSQPQSEAQSEAQSDSQPTAEQAIAQTPERAQEREDDWEKMIAHTRKVMGMAGMPAAALEAMLAEIEEARAGKPSALARHTAAEYAEPSEPSSPRSDDLRDERPNQPRARPTRP